jgi:hypothetical protein
MKVMWAKSDQHTEWGLFHVGDVIDMTALGIPDGVVSSWIKDGYAVPEITAEKPDKPKKIKKTMKEVSHG